MGRSLREEGAREGPREMGRSLACTVDSPGGLQPCGGPGSTLDQSP